MKNVAKSSDHQHQPNSFYIIQSKNIKSQIHSQNHLIQIRIQVKKNRGLFSSEPPALASGVSPLVATRSRLRQLAPVFSALQMASATLAAGPWRRVKAGPRPCWDWVEFHPGRSRLFLALDGAGVPP